MSTQFKLHAPVPDGLFEALDNYFLENESMHWGIMQREAHEPYEVFGIFPDADSARTALLILRNDFPGLPETFSETIIEDADWQNAYKAFVKPWCDRQLHWVPLWEREDYAAPAEAVIIYLDAGMAFGTGAHETTRLCARRLLDYHQASGDPVGPLQIIDAGCGSGILSLSAAALGFEKVLGFDSDPEAIAVCHKNACENPHITKPAFEVSDLNKGLENNRADLLLANIQTDVLITFSSRLVCGICPSGTLALSGILTKEVESVRAHYEAAFAKLHPDADIRVDSRLDGEWSDLQFVLK